MLKRIINIHEIKRLNYLIRILLDSEIIQSN